MDPLQETWRELAGHLADPDWGGAELHPLLRDLAGAAATASPAVLAAVVAEIAAFVRDAPTARGAFAALSGGTLVERGAPAAELFAVLRARVPPVLVAAGRLVARARAAFPDPEELEAQGRAAPSGLAVDGHLLPAGFVREVAAADLESVQCLNGLTQWCLPLIAVATRDRALRAELAADPELVAAARGIGGAHPHAAYLEQLVLAPLAEPLRFVDRATGRVFDLRMDGIAVNFELHTLLAAALAPALGHEPPPASVLACLAGAAGQECSTPSYGTWNLVSWRALAAPAPAPTDQWVWNEGLPAHIEPFEGLRVVVGEPPAYERSWNTGRTFGALAPSVALVRELPEDEARAFLARVSASPG